MCPYSLLYLQITRSDIRPQVKWAVNLVITDATLIFLRDLCLYQWFKIFLVQVRLRTEVPCTPSSTRPGLELMTSRSWQYISCHWDACSNQSAISDSGLCWYSFYNPKGLTKRQKHIKQENRKRRNMVVRKKAYLYSECFLLVISLYMNLQWSTFVYNLRIRHLHVSELLQGITAVGDQLTHKHLQTHTQIKSIYLQICFVRIFSLLVRTNAVTSRIYLNCIPGKINIRSWNKKLIGIEDQLQHQEKGNEKLYYLFQNTSLVPRWGFQPWLMTPTSFVSRLQREPADAPTPHVAWSNVLTTFAQVHLSFPSTLPSLLSLLFTQPLSSLFS